MFVVLFFFLKLKMYERFWGLFYGLLRALHSLPYKLFQHNLQLLNNTQECYWFVYKKSADVRVYLHKSYSEFIVHAYVQMQNTAALQNDTWKFCWCRCNLRMCVCMCVFLFWFGESELSDWARKNLYCYFIKVIAGSEFCLNVFCVLIFQPIFCKFNSKTGKYRQFDLPMLKSILCSILVYLQMIDILQ